MQNIIRKKKLNDLGLHDFTEEENNVVDYIKTEISNLTKCKLKGYRNTFFYFKDKEFRFAIFKDTLYINIHLVFDIQRIFIKNSVSFGIDPLLKDLIKYFYKLNVTHISNIYQGKVLEIENDYRLGNK